MDLAVVTTIAIGIAAVITALKQLAPYARAFYKWAIHDEIYERLEKLESAGCEDEH